MTGPQSTTPTPAETVGAISRDAIRPMLELLAKLRKVLEDAKARLLARRVAWEAEVADLILEVKNANTAVDDQRAIIEAAGLRLYAVTKEKRPMNGVEVKVSKGKTASYDRAKVLEWCKVHGLFLTLDTAAFEAAALAGGLPPELVKIEEKETPKVTIATDLDKALAADAEERARAANAPPATAPLS